MRWNPFPDRERKLESELQFHVEEQVRANMAAGMTAEEARRQANIAFGGLEQIKEECRDQRPTLWLEQSWQDFRYACRQLRLALGFTAVAVITLGLGIGATSAIFSVVNSVLLKPLPYPDSERLVNIRETRLPKVPLVALAPANFVDLRRDSQDVFESIYAERGGGFNLTGSGEPLRVNVNQVTRDFFTALRSQPRLGRAFGPEDEKPGNDHVVILLNGFWVQQFGGRPEVVGTTIQLNETPYTIIGVMGPEFQRDGARAMLMPLALTDQEWASRTMHVLSSYARLKPGATVEQANSRVGVIAGQLARSYPNSNENGGAQAVSILESRSGSSRALMLTLLGAVLLLLLIACTNVANLLLARATTREREIGVRVALGASRGRIARQLLMESLVIALLGALLGLAVGKVGLSLLLTYAPPVLPRAAFEIVLDGRAVLVTICISVATGIGFGLVPAIQGTRVDLSGAMKQGGRSGGSSHRNLTRSALVVIEVALALMLLSGAGLLIRSLSALSTFDPGFNARGITIVGVAAVPKKYDTPEKQAAFAAGLVEGYRALPGVSSVAITQALPLQTGSAAAEVYPEGSETTGNAGTRMSYFSVSPEYFSTLSLRLLRGRLLTAEDRLGSAEVLAISQSAAEQLYPGLDPVGRRVELKLAGRITSREIVGVISDIKPYDATTEILPQVYVPFFQSPSLVNTVLMRFAGPVPPLAAIRQVVYGIDPHQPVAGVYTFEQVLTLIFSRQRFALMLFSTFSVIALILATIGIYGVMAFSVSRRTGEFGVRMALGARPGDVMQLIMGQATRLTGAGILLGALGAMATGRFLQSLLYRTEASDPVVLGGIALLLLGAALLASYIPARRATKVDPIVALRAE
jgi:predicted permease